MAKGKEVCDFSVVDGTVCVLPYDTNLAWTHEILRRKGAIATRTDSRSAQLGRPAMPFTHQFKPTHKEIKRYYEELAGYATQEVTHEGATSSAFQNLLATTCKKADWFLVPQLATKIKGKTVRPDGTLRDSFNLHHGYWEAKDSSDKLDVEIRKKIALGYPLSNTIFEDTATAMHFQSVH